MNDIESEIQWKEILKKLRPNFPEIEDLKDVVFLVGLQELGHGFRKLNKDEKIDVFHIGICHLFSQFGYYEFSGRDPDGWPHWKIVKEIPYLEEGEKELLLKKALIEYFKDGGLI